MNLNEIKTALMSFEAEIEKMEKLWVDKHEGYIEAIIRDYSALKEKLKSEAAKVEINRGQQSATPEEIAFYFPAVNEAQLELYTRSGSKPSEEMMLHLAAASSQISHYRMGIET
jgi:hypothetical protein